MLETRQPPARNDADDIAERLRKSRAPALVVAPVEARLVATNPAGARALGMAANAQPAAGLSLDSAMPAIMQLRRLAGLPDVALQGVVEPLVFWTPGGAARFLCRVRTLDDTLGRHLMLVEPLDHGPHDAERDGTGEATPQIDTECGAIETDEIGVAVAASVDAYEPLADHTLEACEAGEGEPRAARPAPLPPVRDDAEILRAIARQILGGKPTTLAPVTGPAVAVSRASEPQRSAAKPSARSRQKPAARDVIDLDDDPVTAAAPTGAQNSRVSASVACASVDAASGSGTSGDGSGNGSGDGDGSDHSQRRAPRAGADVPPVSEAGAQGAPSDTDTEARATEPAIEPPASAAVAPATRPASSRRALARRIAHELKSPLSAIAAAAEIMKDERFGSIGDERYLRYARDIHESARHALDVVQRMLGAEVENGAAPQLEFTDLDLNAVVAALVSAMEPVAAEAGVRLSASLAAHLPRIVADGTSVRQMALNLVTNALKFTPRGGEVRVSTRAEIDGPLMLEVIDTGPGMSAADIARIEAGEEREAAMPRKGGGFGIGLPLVRSLATANGATLAISTPGAGGTRATIVFPKTRQVLV